MRRIQVYIVVGTVGFGEALHDRLVRRWFRGHGSPGETQEELSAATRVPSLEAEGDLVQIVVQVLPGDRTYQEGGRRAAGRRGVGLGGRRVEPSVRG